MKRFLSYRLVCSLLATLGLVHCQPNTPSRAPTTLAKTIEVPSYSFERETSPALADWKGYQDGDEFIALPPDWQATEQVHTLVLTPGKNQGGQEGLMFGRFDREGDSREVSEEFGQRAAQSTFSSFAVRSDTLKELVFKRDFAFERNVKFAKGGVDYRGYCLIYANDSTFYKYTLILAEQRLQAYDGNLLTDILGNLKIAKNYALRTENPLQQIKIIKP
jgi:hypothetical protein